MNGPVFYVGIRKTGQAKHFQRCCISVNSLRRIRRPFGVGDWIMDSGAFVEILRHGGYRHGVHEYAVEIRRWIGCGNLLIAVAQDWMCEPEIVKITGLSVAEHQRLTVDRYDALKDEDIPLDIMPVLQGFTPDEYRRCLDLYGDRLKPGMWVGVGSVCKRNSDPAAILQVLDAIARERPDLRLHGFGVKKTALRYSPIRQLLATADSMAWSFAARFEEENPHDWRLAQRFVDEVEAIADAPVKMLQSRLEL